MKSVWQSRMSRLMSDLPLRERCAHRIGRLQHADKNKKLGCLNISESQHLYFIYLTLPAISYLVTTVSWFTCFLFLNDKQKF